MMWEKNTKSSPDVGHHVSGCVCSESTPTLSPPQGCTLMLRQQPQDTRRNHLFLPREIQHRPIDNQDCEEVEVVIETGHAEWVVWLFDWVLSACLWSLVVDRWMVMLVPTSRSARMLLCSLFRKLCGGPQKILEAAPNRWEKRRQFLDTELLSALFLLHSLASNKI